MLPPSRAPVDVLPCQGGDVMLLPALWPVRLTPAERRALALQLLAFDPGGALTNDNIRPPYAEWTKRGKRRRQLDENGWHHPDFILVKVTRGKDWWALDDQARALIGEDHIWADLRNGYALVRAACMDRLIAGMGDNAHRLEFRRMPDPPTPAEKA